MGKGAIKGGTCGPIQQVPDENQIYVRNLPSDATETDLYKLFAPFGALCPNGVSAMRNEDGTCKGTGFVDFQDAACAAAAVAALDNFTGPNRTMLKVSVKNSSKGGKGKKDGDADGGKGKG